MPVEPVPSSSQRLGVGSTVGLVLPGGGARAAYQVGVLKAIAELLPGAPNPFPVIVGTSAGAVAAAVLATEAFRWHRAVDALARVWAGFHVEQVFRVVRTGGAGFEDRVVAGALALLPERPGGVPRQRVHPIQRAGGAGRRSDAATLLSTSLAIA